MIPTVSKLDVGHFFPWNLVEAAVSQLLRHVLLWSSRRHQSSLHRNRHQPRPRSSWCLRISLIQSHTHWSMTCQTVTFSIIHTFRMCLSRPYSRGLCVSWLPSIIIHLIFRHLGKPSCGARPPVAQQCPQTKTAQARYVAIGAEGKGEVEESATTADGVAEAIGESECKSIVQKPPVEGKDSRELVPSFWEYIWCMHYQIHLKDEASMNPAWTSSEFLAATPNQPQSSECSRPAVQIASELTYCRSAWARHGADHATNIQSSRVQAETSLWRCAKGTKWHRRSRSWCSHVHSDPHFPLPHSSWVWSQASSSSSQSLDILTASSLAYCNFARVHLWRSLQPAKSRNGHALLQDAMQQKFAVQLLGVSTQLPQRSSFTKHSSLKDFKKILATNRPGPASSYSRLSSLWRAAALDMKRTDSQSFPQSLICATGTLRIKA